MFKVLVAEDEPKSRGALISRLRGILGDAALIEAASDGNDAVDKALRVQPDVIFMDIEMPGKNGLEAAAVIKKQIQTVHIIFLTAYDRFDYAVGAIRSGGEDYILKPVGEVELRESLQKFFDLQTCVVPKTSPFESELAVWVQRHYAEDMALEDAAASLRRTGSISSSTSSVLPLRSTIWPMLPASACCKWSTSSTTPSMLDWCW